MIVTERLTLKPHVTHAITPAQCPNISAGTRDPCRLASSALGTRQAPPVSRTSATFAPALFAWLTARANNGSFVLRIEDTDQRRKVEGAVEMQMEALRWLGVDWDEGPDIGGDYGPYTQSQRLEHYRHAADQLVKSGRAYHCYCSHGASL